MQDIPKWIIKVIEREQLDCRLCKTMFNIDDLMSIGIQESSRKPHNDYLSIGLYCRKCKELMIFELKEMTLLDFAFEILDQETTNKIQKNNKKDDKVILDNKSKKRKFKKSKITKKEVDDVRNFLKDDNLLHEEFLIALGLLPEEIKKYNYKK